MLSNALVRSLVHEENQGVEWEADFQCAGMRANADVVELVDTQDLKS